MRRVVSLLIMLKGISVSVDAVAEVPFNGRSGEGLLAAVAEASRPSAVVDRSRLTFWLVDEFTGSVVEVVAGGLPSGYEWGTFVPVEWWGGSRVEIRGAVASDFYNLLPVVSDVRVYRRDLVPGVAVESVSFSNDFWCAGRGVVYGVETELYVPPERLRGELARAVMYVSTVYHVEIWSPRGFMMMGGSAYPGLTDYAIGVLMAWHRAYPPSVSECEKNSRGEAVQGNRNPFVDYPELAEFLWGEKRGEVFRVEGEPVPLRSTYKLTDVSIDLYSPEIPNDAEWMVDGLPVVSRRLSPGDLGFGAHRLTYSSVSTGERGMLVVKIEK